ncbi:MAG: sigma-70 family RNA polymerase sigma factor, partial [Planctomycetota bacterium]
MSMEADSLLEHAGFLRALTRSLLADPNAAEDVVQQTYLTALEHPPRHRRNLRAWLGVLARNLALRTRRTAVRRARRERRSAQGERIPPADEIAARVELQRKAAEAVLALDEPYRSTIVQRYFDGLSPAEIAQDRGIPVATVKTRLRRAMEQLRSRLDAEHGGNRRAWSALLLPAAWSIRPAAAATVLLAVAVVGTGALVSRASLSGKAPAVRSEAVRVAVVPPEEEPVVAASAVPVAVDARVPSLSPVEPGSVAGRVRLSGWGSALGCTVFLRRRVPGSDGGDVWEERDRAASADGSFEFGSVAPGRYEIEADHPAYAPHKFRFDLDDDEGPFFDILLRRGGALDIAVVGPWGEPLANEHLRVHEEAGDLVHEGFTDSEGRLLCDRLAAGRYEIRRGGLRMCATAVPAEIVDVILEVSCGLTGVVFGPDGGLLRGALVSLRPDEGQAVGVAVADQYGFFAMRGIPEGEHDLIVQAVGDEHYEVRVGRVRLDAGQLLDCPVRIEPTRLAGVVVCEEGTSFDPRNVRLTAISLDGGGPGVDAWADPLGGFAFVGLLSGRYRIEVDPGDPLLQETAGEIDFSRGGHRSGLVFTLRPKRVGRLRLKVLEPDG